MAEKLTLDNGVLEIEINDNGLLRFNPSDPNVYQRFLALAHELPEMETKYTEEVECGDELAQASGILDRMHAIDTAIKYRLNEVFGMENDFDTLLGGVNLLAVGRNGQRVITNLIEALRPYLEKGVEGYRRDVASDAVSKAKQNRAQRRAK